MARFILIDLIAVLALSFLWYAWFVRYNRRRAGKVLHWIQSACLGKGRVEGPAMAGQQLAAEGNSSSFLTLV